MLAFGVIKAHCVRKGLGICDLNVDSHEYILIRKDLSLLHFTLMSLNICFKDCQLPSGTLSSVSRLLLISSKYPSHFSYLHEISIFYFIFYFFASNSAAVKFSITLFHSERAKWWTRRCSTATGLWSKIVEVKMRLYWSHRSIFEREPCSGARFFFF